MRCCRVLLAAACSRRYVDAVLGECHINVQLTQNVLNCRDDVCQAIKFKVLKKVLFLPVALYFTLTFPLMLHIL